MEAPPLRVAVLSRFALVRAGLTSLVLASLGRAVVVDASASDGHLTDIDVVIYDLAALHDPTTRRDLQHLLRSGIPVLGLVRDGREDLADGARTLGVRQTVSERVTPTELLSALAITAGHQEPDRKQRRVAVLTERERLILSLIGAGLSNREIADQLVLSINSVKTYVRLAYRKIGVHTRSNAVLWVIEHGLLPSPGDPDPGAPA